MRIWKAILTCLITSMLLLESSAMPLTAHAQTQVLHSEVNYIFGKQIVFQVEVETDAPLEKAYLVFEETSQTYTSLGEMEITPLENNTYQLVYTHLIQNYSLRVFSTVAYHIELRLKNGQTYTSPEKRFQYSDNRFDWLAPRSEGPFEVYWYEGDQAFAQSVLDVAQEGLKRIQNLLQMPELAPIKIYVYANPSDLQDALSPGGEARIAGHADPDLGVILVALPPGPEQRLLTERRIPHELTHIALYQTTRQGYNNLPVWLNEGIASLAELYFNPDYRIMLENASEQNTLIPIASLCNSFPRDNSGALLAYAQSAAFTQYLHNTYGVTGLQSLVDTYANGISCEKGFKSALGISLAQADRQWQRDALSENVTLSALTNLLPWLLLLELILATPLILLLLIRKERTTTA
jgi:hypothetical protein